MPLIQVSADEINCLIHSYLQDSGRLYLLRRLWLPEFDKSLGFHHSAYNLRQEGNLNQSSNFTKVIRRGELIELLYKALLYTEVEAHWNDVKPLKPCKGKFSLLDIHTCSTEPDSGAVPTSQISTTERRSEPLHSDGLPTDVVVKRKLSPEDNRPEKRFRAERNDRDAAEC